MGVMGDHMPSAHGDLHGCSYGAYMGVFMMGTGVFLMECACPSHARSTAHHVPSPTIFAYVLTLKTESLSQWY